MTSAPSTRSTTEGLSSSIASVQTATASPSRRARRAVHPHSNCFMDDLAGARRRPSAPSIDSPTCMHLPPHVYASCLHMCMPPTLRA